MNESITKNYWHHYRSAGLPHCEKGSKTNRPNLSLINASKNQTLQQGQNGSLKQDRRQRAIAYTIKKVTFYPTIEDSRYNWTPI